MGRGLALIMHCTIRIPAHAYVANNCYGNESCRAVTVAGLHVHSTLNFVHFLFSGHLV